MRRIAVIGIGTGNPDHVTIEAVAALNQADVFFLPDKGQEKTGLADLRRAIIDRHVVRSGRRIAPMPIPERGEAGADYDATVLRWHETIAARYEALIRESVAEDECGAFLVWGDPGLYDSTLRILARIRARGLDFDLRVVAGITSIQALTAAHAATLNRIGRPVLITTGRQLRQSGPPVDDAVVMLDGEQSFTGLVGQGYEILWGAYLGSPDEILVAGALDAVADEILRCRAEARARKGWIMDTYLLRRIPSG